MGDLRVACSCAVSLAIGLKETRRVPLNSYREIIKETTVTQMDYFAIVGRGEQTKINREKAIDGLAEKAYHRVQISNGTVESNVTIDRFNCEPYQPFQVFDRKIHHAGGCHSASEAVELAELSIMVDET